jgi:hypothetical protein
LSQGLRGGRYPTPVFFAKSAELFENKKVAFFGDTKKCKITQKSAQGHEKKVDKGSGIEARKQMITDLKLDPHPPINDA